MWGDWLSDSSSRSWGVCWTFNSALFSELCPIISWYLAKAASKPLLWRVTVITVCIMCAMQGSCLNGRFLAASWKDGSLVANGAHSTGTLLKWNLPFNTLRACLHSLLSDYGRAFGSNLVMLLICVGKKNLLRPLINHEYDSSSLEITFIPLQYWQHYLSWIIA